MIVNDFKSFEQISITDLPYLKKLPNQLVVPRKFAVGSDGIFIQHFFDKQYLGDVIGNFNLHQRIFVALQIVNLIESLDSIYEIDLSLNNFVVDRLFFVKAINVEIKRNNENVFDDIKLLIIEILSGKRSYFVIKPDKLVASIYEANSIDELQNILRNEIDFNVVKRSNNNGSIIKNLLSKSFWKRKHFS